MSKHRFPPRPDPKDLEKFGPRLEVEVGPPIVRTGKGLAVLPSPAAGSQRFSRMPALIDTGSSRTVLTPEAVQRVGLAVVDRTQLSRAGGIDRVTAHVASIQFPRYKIATIEVIQVLCCELPHQPIQCLIGRDILSRWVFTYDGKSGEWFIEEEELAAWVEPPEGTLT